MLVAGTTGHFGREVRALATELVDDGPSALERHLAACLGQSATVLGDDVRSLISIVPPPARIVAEAPAYADLIVLATDGAAEPPDATGAPADTDLDEAPEHAATPGAPPAESSVDAAVPPQAFPQPLAAADPVEALSSILEAVTVLGETDWHEVTGERVHQALDILEQLDRRLAGLRSSVLTTAETNRLWALDGQRTFKSWLQQRTDTTPGAASRQVRHARALRDYLPLTRQALEAGRISPEHVAVLVLVREAIRTNRLRAQLSDPELGEAFLVTQAEAMNAATFTKLVKHWTIAADPEAADPAPGGRPRPRSRSRCRGRWTAGTWPDGSTRSPGRSSTRHCDPTWAAKPRATSAHPPSVGPLP